MALKHFVSRKPSPCWHKHDVDWVSTLQLGKKKLDHDANAKKVERAKKREQLAIEQQEREAAELESSLPVVQIDLSQPSASSASTEEEGNQNEENEVFSSDLAAI